MLLLGDRLWRSTGSLPRTLAVTGVLPLTRLVGLKPTLMYRLLVSVVTKKGAYISLLWCQKDVRHMGILIHLHPFDTKFDQL